MFTKTLNFIKKNYLLILAYLIPIILIGFSFTKYYKEYYSLEQYEKYYQACQENKDEVSCQHFNTIKQLNEQYKETDTKTYFFEILNHYIDNYIVVLAPLLVILQTIHFLHKEFSSGFLKNKLTRMSYKQYQKKFFTVSLKSAIILPLIILTIFILSGLITKFNFTTPEWVYKTSVYNANNYNNFFLYLVSSCLIVYFMGIFYSNIALAFLNKSKNSLLVIIFSYLCFFVFVILFDVGGSILLIRLLKLNPSISAYLNIFDYWYINGENNYLYFIIISFSLALLSHVIDRVIYKNKEVTIIEVEKEFV